jgi:hypothetical protein
MKKLMSILLFISIVLSSCGSSIESDAKKEADLMIKSMSVFQKQQKGEISLEEGLKIAKEADEVKEANQKKYSSGAEKEKFDKALEKALLDNPEYSKLVGKGIEQMGNK